MNHFLLIDDDEIITIIHQAILRRVDNNCIVDVCKNGNEALEYLKKICFDGSDSPNYIFLDINMPLMSGFEFLDKLDDSNLNIHENTNIIMLSSSIDPRDIEKAKHYPVVKEFAAKPLTIDYLSKLLELS